MIGLGYSVGLYKDRSGILYLCHIAPFQLNKIRSHDNHPFKFCDTYLLVNG